MLIIGLVAGVFAARPSSRPVDRAETAAPSLDDVARRVLNDPDASRVELISPDGTMVASAAIDADGDGYLLASGLPALSEAETYQLWAVGDGAVVSVGVLGHTPEVVAFHVDPGEALQSSVACVGTVDEICDLLVQRREEWGVSYVVFGDDNFEAFSPVVARLAGT